MDANEFMPSEAAIAGIKHDLEAYEAERAKVAAAVRWRVPVFLGSLLAAVVLVAWLINPLADPFEQWFSTPHVIIYVLAFVAAFFVWAAAMSPATKLQQSFRDKILPIVFGFVRDMKYRHAGTPDSFDRLPREAVGTFNRQSFDDVIAGRYEDFPFELYEASFAQKAGKNTTNVFRGVVVAFETLAPFPGLLVASRRVNKVVGFFRGLFGDKLQEVHSRDADLDLAYEFRTDNVSAAEPLVSGRLAQALKWLGEQWPEQPARVALNGADGFLLIPLTKNFFELPSIGTPLDYRTHVAPMIADMGALLATAALVRKIGQRDGS